MPKSDLSNMSGDGSRPYKLKDGFHGEINSFGYPSLLKEEAAASISLTPQRIRDPRIEAYKKSTSSISTLRDLVCIRRNQNQKCTMEGLDVVFQNQPQFLARGQKNEVYATVEINGQVLGKGIGLTWDDAKAQAAEKALGALKTMLGPSPYRRQGSARTMQDMSSKRFKPEIPRGLQRMPSAGRWYS